MGDSNGAWGQLAEHDDERAEVWDKLAPIPEPGENPALDAFVARKHLTHASLVRVGTRMAAYDVLAFAGPGYIKYRNVVNDQRWSYPDCDWSKLRIIRAGAAQARTVLVSEGESDSARLTDAYAPSGADVAILPAGAGYFPAGYAAQLSSYELVLAALDTDEAGERGAQHIVTTIPQAQRFAPPANDWCAVEPDDLPPLPSPEDFETPDLRVGGLVFRDLSTVMQDGAVPDPEVLVDDLLYTEGVHFFNGHPGSGKTTLVMHTALMAMSEGRELVWLDYEGGIRPTVRRMLACGCAPEWILSKFHYCDWPRNVGESLEQVALKWPNALIVYDSASKALQTEGFDENSPSEVTGWATEIVKVAKQYTVPIIIIDHVAKVATKSALYGRGAGSKMADADVAWYVEKVSDFNRDTQGVICVHQQKDREGFLPFSSWYQLGDGKGKLTLEPIEPPLEDEPDSPPTPSVPADPTLPAI